MESVELLEEPNLQLFEARGRYPTNDHFQVSANASEAEQAKVMWIVTGAYLSCLSTSRLRTGNVKKIML